MSAAPGAANTTGGNGATRLPVAASDPAADSLRVAMQTASLAPPPLIDAGRIPWLWPLLATLDLALLCAIVVTGRGGRKDRMEAHSR